MQSLSAIRASNSGILVIGHHPAITQSILDCDFLAGKPPSIVAIVTGNRKAEKYFFGDREMLIPCYASIDAIPAGDRKPINWMLNLQSGRRVFSTVTSFFSAFPKAFGGHIFAENVPESHSTQLIKRFGKDYLLVGPSGVGFLVPGVLKLGAIGGVDARQIKDSALTTPGSIAVGSTSGGMTNELIRAVVGAGKRISFAVAVGGDRFPIASLTQIFELAQKDKQTKAFVYFGELGGTDEYEIIELIKAKRFTKPLVAYIAGVIDEAFDDHVQFGHAKAFVQQKNESARAKREALRGAGVIVPDTFPEFLKALAKLPSTSLRTSERNIEPLMQRQKSILSTRKISDLGKNQPFVRSALEALLGRKVKSLTTLAFVERVFTLLIDHGGNVSGAVNTMITARAGKDMVSSLASGLLTIGPRFGGAINDAAGAWLAGVRSGTTAAVFVEEKNKACQLVLGIGHRKYRVGLPDPRVAELSRFASKLKRHPYYDFACAVEKITTGKNGALILNVDGVVAALLLDIFMECEKMEPTDLQALVDAEFFNAFFVIPRTVGFIAHFLEQKQNDEGLFRLPDELLFTRGGDEKE